MALIDSLTAFEHQENASRQNPPTLAEAMSGLTGGANIEHGSGAYSNMSRFQEVALKNANILVPKELDRTRFTKFAKTPILDPWHNASFVREYTFFTKPDLHIFTSDRVLNPALEDSEYFPTAIETHPESMRALQQTYVTPGNAWNYLLSNYSSSSIDMPGLASETTLGNQNLYGINTWYQDSSRAQEYNFDFSVEFMDTSFLDVYSFFAGYTEYKNLQYDKDIMPVKASYIGGRNRYKSFSIYKLLVDETDRIIYFGKHIGVEPLNRPSDTIDSLDGSAPVRFTVNFKSFHSIEMKPVILTEINLLSKRAGFKGDLIPYYDRSISAASKEWGAVPWIIESTYNNRKIFLLRWGRI